MSVSINGTGGITFADASTQSTGGYTGFRNRIINGAMMIDQRNAGASVVSNNNTIYAVDRFSYFTNGSATGTLQQSSTAPTGFVNSLLYTVGSGSASGSTTRAQLIQRIEGYNISDLAWGSASASPITLSFWVRSSLTGTFGGSLQNYAQDRSYPFTYAISAANTWQQKTITIAGDTSGTWLTTNGTGIQVYWDMGCGSSLTTTAGAWASGDYRGATGATSVVGTSGATFYITGVQLEKGSVATPFEFRQYGQELALCQRYFYTGLTVRYAGATTGAYGPSYSIHHPVQMRTAPTITFASTSFANNVTSISSGNISTSGFTAYYGSNGTGGGAGEGVISANAEL